MTQNSAGAPLSDLVVGDTAETSLYDREGLLLIAEGVQITEALIDSLRRRRIRTLHVKPANSPPKDDAKPPTLAQPAISSSSVKRGQRFRSASAKHENDPVFGSLSTNYSAKKVERIRRQFDAGEKAVTYLSQIYGRSDISNLRRTDVAVDDYVRELVDDPDPVVAGAIAYDPDLELARRCVQFSVLSLAIASRMEMDESMMPVIGSAAMMHDWALFDTDASKRFPHQCRDAQSRQRYEQHPLDSVGMLETVQSIDPRIAVYVSQVHEQLDGTGFPRGLTGDAIETASRVLSVADAYLTLTSPPSGSPRVVPCDAIAYLVNAASIGRYSSAAVRGLLRAVTLYPIGSILELSDASRVRCIRTNGNDYGYPIVESMLDATKVINLKESDLFVTRPIVSEERREVRLTDTQVQLSEAISRL